jgi:hypothetical protein
MGRPTLEGVDLKLERAKECFDTLGKAINEFLTEPSDDRLRAEQHPERGGIFKVQDVRRPPPDWGILIGDCVHHYRSALDHLAFQLVVANTRGRLPAKAVKRSEFPIFNSGPKFRGRRNRKGEPSPGSGRAKIHDIPRPAQAVIERLQPYHRRKNPGARSLWQLQELANIDKHRLLHVTYSSIRGSTFRITEAVNVAELRDFHFEPGPLKRNAVVAQWRTIPIDPRYGTKLNMDADMLTDVVFGKASPARSVQGESVPLTLFEIGAFIASDVLPPLTDFLGLTSRFKPGRMIDLEPLSIEEREALGERTLVQSLST